MISWCRSTHLLPCLTRARPAPPYPLPPARSYRNALHCFYRVAKEEGLRGIQAGLSVGIVYQIAMNGTRLGLFKPVCSVYGVGAAGDSEATRFLKTLGVSAAVGAPPCNRPRVGRPGARVVVEGCRPVRPDLAPPRPLC